jgi:hypothetical protein
MPIYWGGDEITSQGLNVGSTPVVGVYVGAEQVWPTESLFYMPSNLIRDATTAITVPVIALNSAFEINMTIIKYPWLGTRTAYVADAVGNSLIQRDNIGTIRLDIDNDRLTFNILSSITDGEVFSLKLTRPVNSNVVSASVNGGTPQDSSSSNTNRAFNIDFLYGDGSSDSLETGGGWWSATFEDITLGNIYSIPNDEGSGNTSRVLLNGAPFTLATWDPDSSADWALKPT